MNIKKSVIYPCHRKLPSNKKKWTIDSHHILSGPFRGEKYISVKNLTDNFIYSHFWIDKPGLGDSTWGLSLLAHLPWSSLSRLWDPSHRNSSCNQAPSQQPAPLPWWFFQVSLAELSDGHSLIIICSLPADPSRARKSQENTMVSYRVSINQTWARAYVQLGMESAPSQPRSGEAPRRRQTDAGQSGSKSSPRITLPRGRPFALSRGKVWECEDAGPPATGSAACSDIEMLSGWFNHSVRTPTPPHPHPRSAR